MEKTIYKKLHKIMSEIPFIEKDGHNDFHKYDYASEKIIKTTIQKKLVENKLLFIPNITDVNIEQKPNKDGAITTIKTKFAFVDVESGEREEFEFAGQGDDKGDKGIYKAITGAIKYFLTSTFLIPTGEDPEKPPKAHTSQYSAPKTFTNTKGQDTQKVDMMCPECKIDAILKKSTGTYFCPKWKENHTPGTFIKMIPKPEQQPDSMKSFTNSLPEPVPYDDIPVIN